MSVCLTSAAQTGLRPVATDTAEWFAVGGLLLMCDLLLQTFMWLNLLLDNHLSKHVICVVFAVFKCSSAWDAPAAIADL